MTPVSHPRRSRLDGRGRRLVAFAILLVLSACLAIAGLAGPAVGWKARLAAVGERAALAFDILQGRAGWTIRRIVVEGAQGTPPERLAEILDPLIGRAALAIDLDTLRRRLERIPWVRSAEVRRRLPDRLLVTIAERHPAARWQREGRFFLLAADGTPLAPLASAEDGDARLPLVVGKGANEALAGLLDLARRHPDLFAQLRAAVRVGGRRWDLWLAGNLRVMLPDGEGDGGWDAARALDRLAELERRHLLLERDLVAIDLRIADRVTLTRPQGHRHLLAQPGGKA